MTDRLSRRRVLVFAVLCAGALLMIGPLIWAVSTSLKAPADVFSTPPKLFPSPLTLEGYKDVFTVLPFPRYLLNSIIVAVSIVALNVVFGTAAAYAFAKLRFPGRNLIFGALLITLMVPFQVNLIPLNPTVGYAGEPTRSEPARRFQKILAEEFKLPSTVRQRRGIDIAAGCGQLAVADAG